MKKISIPIFTTRRTTDWQSWMSFRAEKNQKGFEKSSENLYRLKKEKPFFSFFYFAKHCLKNIAKNFKNFLMPLLNTVFQCTFLVINMTFLVKVIDRSLSRDQFGIWQMHYIFSNGIFLSNSSFLSIIKVLEKKYLIDFCSMCIQKRNWFMGHLSYMITEAQTQYLSQLQIDIHSMHRKCVKSENSIFNNRAFSQKLFQVWQFQFFSFVFFRKRYLEKILFFISLIKY